MRTFWLPPPKLEVTVPRIRRKCYPFELTCRRIEGIDLAVYRAEVSDNKKIAAEAQTTLFPAPAAKLIESPAQGTVLIAAIEQTADLPAFTKANSTHGCNPVRSFTCMVTPSGAPERIKMRTPCDGRFCLRLHSKQ
jgi:hypothetical protein